ncbi:hypothetical protein DFP94_101475 [Fontibacillus phaseoli]|uniref:Phage ABA sandwich domain-containing protein n=1 Tax=Fontibacillus phaseoli TaxID=1416533 RepID=A0A369BQL2_9BACL|nr:hypothetical protein [Fontibacillus phaseoli]RCX22886.1 hypothetical protein DFP94_101475 [Fontibacillus phaseoli]
MTRGEIIAKWDGMAPRERDAWVAEAVFGWRKEERPNSPESEYNAWYWVNSSGNVEVPVNFFKPTRLLDDAWSVLEVFYAYIVKRNDGVNHYFAAIKTDEGAFVSQAYGEAAPEAMCLAAIIARLTEEVAA